MFSSSLLIRLIGFSIIAFVSAKDCLDCICDLESGGCKPIGCNMDEGTLSCGYFQIKIDYYQDCGTPGRGDGEDLETAWKRCSDDYNCARQCIDNFINRYTDLCPNKSGCERISYLHNSGPFGCQASRSDWYWDKIRACI